MTSSFCAPPATAVVFVAFITLSTMVAGCSAGAMARSNGISNVVSALAGVGATATGFCSVQSTTELNSANKELMNAQTMLTETQVRGTQAERERLAQERIVTARLLREKSASYNEQIFRIMAEWVKAGGDPDFAFKFAIARIGGNGGVKVLPQKTLGVAQPLGSAPVERALQGTSQDALTYPELFPY